MSLMKPNAWLMARGKSAGELITASRRTPNVLRSPRCEVPPSRRPICRPVVLKKLLVGEEEEAGELGEASPLDVGELGAEGVPLDAGRVRGAIEAVSLGAARISSSEGLRTGGGRPFKALSSLSTSKRRFLVF